MVQSHDIRVDSSATADTYVYISNVLPAEITEADLPEFAARGFDGGIVSRISCHYYSDRVNALTQEVFEQFFTDNPAYRVDQNLNIYNDKPSVKEEAQPVAKRMNRMCLTPSFAYESILEIPFTNRK